MVLKMQVLIYFPFLILSIKLYSLPSLELYFIIFIIKDTSLNQVVNHSLKSMLPYFIITADPYQIMVQIFIYFIMFMAS